MEEKIYPRTDLQCSLLPIPSSPSSPVGKGMLQNLVLTLWKPTLKLKGHEWYTRRKMISNALTGFKMDSI